MAQTSDEQKQALREEAELLQRLLPTAQTAKRLEEIAALLGTSPDDEDLAVADSKRKTGDAS